jgi:hypothetical protein
VFEAKAAKPASIAPVTAAASDPQPASDTGGLFDKISE